MKELKLKTGKNLKVRLEALIKTMVYSPKTT
jgi:hypothetical protein